MKFNRINLAALLTLTALLAQAAYAGAGYSDPVKHEINGKDLKARMDKNESVVILDARSHLNGQMIKGAVHVPASKLEEWAKTADKNAIIVTYCTCPHDEAAEEEMHQLRDLGFTSAFSLKGGLEAARAAGLEIIPVSE
jgi:rhodanese-related sulfurtransferase